MTILKAKAIALAFKLAVGYLRKHPELLDKVSDQIPGKLDDAALRMIARRLGI
jgi:hypothetical protein